MATISGGPSDKTKDFQPNAILEAAKLNKALENWVVTEVPGDDVGEIGDVVFVTGPGDGGSSSSVGGGKVLQVVRATDGTNRSTTSTSYVDVTGMSVTITPTNATSEILLVASGILWATWTTGVDGYAFVQITDSSNNGVSGAEGSLYGMYGLDGTGTRYAYTPFTMIARAAPATTSAVTYKMRQKVDVANVTSTVRNSFSTGQMYAIEVAA